MHKALFFVHEAITLQRINIKFLRKKRRIEESVTQPGLEEPGNGFSHYQTVFLENIHSLKL